MEDKIADKLASMIREKGEKKAIESILRAVVIFIFVVVSCVGSFYSVSEQEQAVVTQFGKVVGVETAGLHFKLPFIQKVSKVNTTTQGIAFR